MQGFQLCSGAEKKDPRLLYPWLYVPGSLPRPYRKGLGTKPLRTLTGYNRTMLYAKSDCILPFAKKLRIMLAIRGWLLVSLCCCASVAAFRSLRQSASKLILHPQ